MSDVAWCGAHDPLRLVTSGDDGMMRVWRVKGRGHGDGGDSQDPSEKRSYPTGENGQQVVGTAKWVTKPKHCELVYIFYSKEKIRCGITHDITLSRAL